MILDEIVAAKKEELTKRKQTMPLAELESNRAKNLKKLDFALALSGDGIRLIAEVKKASPSRGMICPDLDPVKLARTYADNGASAISVLTEAKYFKGSLEYLASIHHELQGRKPLLRKDFIFDPYQVYESSAYGADALLLIVSILSEQQLAELLSLSQSLAWNAWSRSTMNRSWKGPFGARRKLLVSTTAT